MNDNFKSTGISLFMVRLFAVLLAALTVGAYPALKWYCETFNWDKSLETRIMLTIGIYIALPFAWLTLYSLHRLLMNIRANKIFDNDNVKMLGNSALSCFAVAAIGLTLILIYAIFMSKFALSFAIVTVAAFFVGLMVRVVQNVFRAAIDIKEENDLTV